MIVEFTPVFNEKSLETVAEASCEEISTILTIGMYTIISLSCWMTIDVLEGLPEENVGANKDIVLDITFLKLITGDFVAICREF